MAALMLSLTAATLLLLPFISNALFIRPPSVLKPFPSLRLATADRLFVPYRGIAHDAGEAASLPGFALSLDAEFGALDQSTFNALQEKYCSWSETKSRVKWHKGRRYTLLDFLPPLLQAASGLYFRSSRTTQKGLPSFLGGPNQKVEEETEQEVLLACNCWGFAWEVLFQADNADVRSMTISTADPTSAWRAFTGRGFDLIQTSRAQPKLLTEKTIRNRKLRAGDVLLLWHQIPGKEDELYLDHVAIMIDDDVYYEKSGNGDRTPFRITTWEGLTANWPPNIFEWEWRRLCRLNLLPSARGSLRPIRRLPPASRLKPASEIFGVDAQVANANLPKRFNLLGKVRPSVAKKLSLTTQGENGVVEAHIYTGIHVLEDIVFDKDTGRASLPRSAFTQRYFMQLPRLPSNPYL